MKTPIGYALTRHTNPMVESYKRSTNVIYDCCIVPDLDIPIAEDINLMGSMTVGTADLFLCLDSATLLNCMLN